MKINPAEKFKNLADKIKRHKVIDRTETSFNAKALMSEVKRIFDDLYEDILESINSKEDINSIDLDEDMDSIESDEYYLSEGALVWTKNRETQYFLEHLGFGLTELKFSLAFNSKLKMQHEKRVNSFLRSAGHDVTVTFDNFPFIDDELEDEIREILLSNEDDESFENYQLIDADWSLYLDKIPITANQLMTILEFPKDAVIWEMSWRGEPFVQRKSNKYRDLQYPKFWDVGFIAFITSPVGCEFFRHLLKTIESAALNVKYEIYTEMECYKNDMSVQISELKTTSENFEINLDKDAFTSFLNELGFKTKCVNRHMPESKVISDSEVLKYELMISWK